MPPSSRPKTTPHWLQSASIIVAYERRASVMLALTTVAIFVYPVGHLLTPLNEIHGNSIEPRPAKPKTKRPTVQLSVISANNDHLFSAPGIPERKLSPQEAKDEELRGSVLMLCSQVDFWELDYGASCCEEWESVEGAEQAPVGMDHYIVAFDCLCDSLKSETCPEKEEEVHAHGNSSADMSDQPLAMMTGDNFLSEFSNTVSHILSIINDHSGQTTIDDFPACHLDHLLYPSLKDAQPCFEELTLFASAYFAEDPDPYYFTQSVLDNGMAKFSAYEVNY